MTWVPSISSQQRPRTFLDKSLKPFLRASQESPRPAGEQPASADGPLSSRSS